MADEPVIFIVSGEPRPKQSFKYTKDGRGYTPKLARAWQTRVSLRAREAMDGREIIQGPLTVRLIFCLGDGRRVDLDNLSKGTLDALKGIVFMDDSQVMDLHLKKSITPTPGVHVEIRPERPS